ncbi:hypothetical protein EX30DRAFT_242076 [Ascodesmis nigricans]|uniref:Uncharacterized protein n=1 Tax=Ascodesmis nigricans TaxID=341454 RepID=A0A4S2MZ47_9PEZI|nr:hypothetical protein EX30DRAFT_242076 [Ascodesmis nigricans]
MQPYRNPTPFPCLPSHSLPTQVPLTPPHFSSLSTTSSIPYHPSPSLTPSFYYPPSTTSSSSSYSPSTYYPSRTPSPLPFHQYPHHLNIFRPSSSLSSSSTTTSDSSAPILIPRPSSAASSSVDSYAYSSSIPSFSLLFAAGHPQIARPLSAFSASMSAGPEGAEMGGSNVGDKLWGQRPPQNTPAASPAEDSMGWGREETPSSVASSEWSYQVVGFDDVDGEAEKAGVVGKKRRGKGKWGRGRKRKEIGGMLLRERLEGVVEERREDDEDDEDNEY